MPPEVLLEALRRAGATFLDEPDSSGIEGKVPGGTASPPVTKADLFAWGLSGGTGSAARRRALLHALSFPEQMSANALLEALNLLYSREEIAALIRDILDAANND